MRSMRSIAIMAALAAALQPMICAAQKVSSTIEIVPPAPRSVEPRIVDNGKSWGRPKKSKRNRKSRGA